ncbi:MAG: hypothetical protein IPN34_27420 [Planctomycetes bacterium]|nr:hypothetical protein [Planctomycetota bacterium]
MRRLVGGRTSGCEPLSTTTRSARWAVIAGGFVTALPLAACAWMRSSNGPLAASKRSSAGCGPVYGSSTGTPLVSVQSGAGTSAMSSSSSGKLRVLVLVRKLRVLHELHSVAGSPLESRWRTQST